MHLPDGFRVSATPVDFRGKKVRSLQYHHQYISDTGYVSFYKNDVNHKYALKVKVNDSKDELTMYSCQTCNSWLQAKADADSLTNRGAKYVPANNESVLIPELDFNIVKDFDKTETQSNPVFSNYALAEERIKFKISAPKEGSRLGSKQIL